MSMWVSCSTGFMPRGNLPRGDLHPHRRPRLPAAHALRALRRLPAQRPAQLADPVPARVDVHALTGERGATAVAAARGGLAQRHRRLAQELALEVALADGREDPVHAETFAVTGAIPLERGFRSASSRGPLLEEPDPSPLTVVAEQVGSERRPPNASRTRSR